MDVVSDVRRDDSRRDQAMTEREKLATAVDEAQPSGQDYPDSACGDSAQNAGCDETCPPLLHMLESNIAEEGRG